LCMRKMLGFPRRPVLMSWKGAIVALFSSRYPGPDRVFHFTRIQGSSILSPRSPFSCAKRTEYCGSEENDVMVFWIVFYF
jgi:hypothetical protein